MHSLRHTVKRARKALRSDRVAVAARRFEAGRPWSRRAVGRTRPGSLHRSSTHEPRAAAAALARDTAAAPPEPSGAHFAAPSASPPVVRTPCAAVAIDALARCARGRRPRWRRAQGLTREGARARPEGVGSASAAAEVAKTLIVRLRGRAEQGRPPPRPRRSRQQRRVEPALAAGEDGPGRARPQRVGGDARPPPRLGRGRRCRPATFSSRAMRAATPRRPSPPRAVAAASLLRRRRPPPAPPTPPPPPSGPSPAAACSFALPVSCSGALHLLPFSASLHASARAFSSASRCRRSCRNAIRCTPTLALSASGSRRRPPGERAPSSPTPICPRSTASRSAPPPPRPPARGRRLASPSAPPRAASSPRAASGAPLLAYPSPGGSSPLLLVAPSSRRRWNLGTRS